MSPPPRATSTRAIGTRSRRGSERLRTLVQLLISHAEHEEEFVQPVLKQYAPKLADVIVEDHVALEKQMACIEVLSDRIVDAISTERRRLTHRLYLALASFTAEYLQHQAFEELEIAPALAGFVSSRGVGCDRPRDRREHPARTDGDRPVAHAAGDEHRGPFRDARRHEARRAAPVLAGVQALAQSVLAPSDYAALAVRVDAA